MVFKYLKKREVISLHRLILKNYGGTPGLLSEGNLELSIEKPEMLLFGDDQFPSLPEKAACFFHDLNKLHPFIDGNKRTAFEAMKIFLARNGYSLNISTDESVQVSRQTAECTKNMMEIVSWIKQVIIKIKQ